MGQWVTGKSCETFNLLGPWVATPDETAGLQELGLWLDVNGSRRQDGTTADSAAHERPVSDVSTGGNRG